MLDGGMNRLVAHRKASDAVRHHERLMKAPARGARSARTVMVRPAEAFKAGDERPARLRVVSPQPQRLSGTAKI